MFNKFDNISKMFNKFTVFFLVAASVAVVSYSFTDQEQDGFGQYTGSQEHDQYRRTFHIEEVEDNEEAWEKFKEQFDRHYSTLDEENFRKDIFMSTLQDVREHNDRYQNQEVSYSLGINQFSDLTQEELETSSSMKRHTVNIEQVEDDDEAWELFKREYHRDYPTLDEENFRRDIFLATLRSVREHNDRYRNKEVSYSQGINQFCDLTQEEFQSNSNTRQYGTRPVSRHLSRVHEQIPEY